MANGNPRLEVEVAVSGLGKATRDFGTLQKELQDTSREFSKANATALELERELRSLSTSLSRGAISQDKYDKEVREVSVALSSARQAAQQYQSRINSLNATIAQGANSGRQYGNEIGKLQGVHDSVTRGIRGSSSVSLEFSRIIQDAPYGIQGVANNIQQLTTNLGYYTKNIRESLVAQGKQASGMAVFRTALGGLISPIGLVTLGVSALTAGWVLYDRWQQRSKKSIDETKQSLTTYIETLNGVARAQADGQANALKELTTVEQLYKATQNVNLPMKDRIENARELIKQGGELFKSTTAEAVVAGQASEAYDKLTNSIRQTAMAQAYMQRMTENATKALNNNLNIINEANEILKLNQQISQQESITTAGQSVGAASETIENANVRELNKLYDKRQERIDNINRLNKENASVLKEQDMLQKGINTSIENGGSLVNSTNTGLKSGNKNLQEARALLADIQRLTDLIQRDSLSKFDQKLFDINKKYDEIFEKIKDEGLLGMARENMNAEKMKVHLERIVYLSKQLPSTLALPTVSTAVTMPTQLQTRSTAAVAAVQFSDDLSTEIRKGLSRGIGRAFTDLYNNIDDLGSNFYQVFTNVFQKLSGYVGNIMSDVIGRYLGEKLGDKIDAGDFNIGGLSTKVSTALVAGASLAGKVLGGMISRESVVGQGAAGALSGVASGAAAGAAIGGTAGGPIGAVIGGVVGLISGIFGAKEAKRQRELQEQQLAEQRKQTALMERQAMLAYSASVVGQQINGGVVTAVERDAYGNVVAKINGKDIELVLERTKSGRG